MPLNMLAASSTSAFDQPGTLGFLVVAGMAVILVFLFRSMTKHLRKVKSGPFPSAKDPARTGQASASAPSAVPDDGQPGSRGPDSTTTKNE